MIILLFGTFGVIKQKKQGEDGDGGDRNYTRVCRQVAKTSTVSSLATECQPHWEQTRLRSKVFSLESLWLKRFWFGRFIL